MVGNRVQFAVVREDPEIESAVVERLIRDGATRPRLLLVGSGGCTALVLQRRFPQCELVLLEPNPAQIDLIQKKARALQELSGEQRRCAFTIGSEAPDSLNACGNFESLFRLLRAFLGEFVMDRAGWLQFFDAPSGSTLESIFSSPYWSTAFQLFFSDPLLRSMFGPRAIQHAPPSSYPRHFQQVFETGLARPDARDNYFLHHVLWGHYLDRLAALPAYLADSSDPRALPAFRFEPKLAEELEDFGDFDLVSFSNIFDWMDEREVRAVCSRFAAQARPGARAMYRQLNNLKDFRPFFGHGVTFDQQWATTLYARDRSLFYSSLHLGWKER